MDEVITIKYYDINNNDDCWDLATVLEDNKLEDYYKYNEMAKHIYLIKKYENCIGFICLLELVNSDAFEIKYGIYSECDKNDIKQALILLQMKINQYKDEDHPLLDTEKDLFDRPIFQISHRLDTYENDKAIDNGYIIYADSDFNFYLLEDKIKPENNQKNMNKIMQLMLKKTA